MASAVLSTGAVAQISTDASLGRPAQTLVGPHYVIPETLGRVAGSNLFHSFHTFNIGRGQSANFTTATASLANVISRVTGGTLSQIDGLLRLTPVGGAPNFFLINPAGVTFGAGAAIDVPGAFHVSTANYIRFPDGNFQADLNHGSSFSSAPPEAFGYLGTTRAAVTVSNGALLAAKPGQSISIVGGDVEIRDATVASTGGEIRVGAVGQRVREIDVSGALPALSGTLALRDGGGVSSETVSSEHSGPMRLSAGAITIDGQTFPTGVSSATRAGTGGNAASIHVSATGHLTIVGAGFVSSSTESAGTAGSVSVNAGSIEIDGKGMSGGIFTRASNGGNAGAVNVSTTSRLGLINGGSIFSSAFDSSRNTGRVTVVTDALDIDGKGAGKLNTAIYTLAVNGSGDAGAVEVAASGNLSISNDGVISSSTFSGSGDAGAVRVRAGSIRIDGQGSSGGIESAANDRSGRAGFVDVSTAGNLSIAHGGQISSSASESLQAGSVVVRGGNIDINGHGIPTGIFSTSANSTGRAGDVQVAAVDSLSIVNGGRLSSKTESSGSAGSVNVNADSIRIDGQGTLTGISSELTSSTGDAGVVDVTAARGLSIANGARISSSAEFSSGNAGSVIVRAGTIDINGAGTFAGIFSEAVATAGNAGLVDIAAGGNLSVVNGGVISSSTISSGDAGSVKVTAGTIRVDGQGNRSGIFSEAIGTAGNAGIVQVAAPGDVSIVNGGEVATSTSSPGHAGAVEVIGGSIQIDAAGIFSDTTSAGHAGLVRVSTAGNLSIVNGGDISSSTVSSGNGGAVIVTAGSIRIDGLGGFASISSLSTGGSGDAGVVEISAARHLAVADGGSISSSTSGASGNAGSVRVNAGSIGIDGQARFAGIFSQASGSTGDAGVVAVTAREHLSIVNGGVISSTTFSSGKAGSVIVRGRSIRIDGQGNSAGIFSEARGTAGDAGAVEVTALGNLSIVNASGISSSTFAPGNAGSVVVRAGSIEIDAQGSSRTGIFSDTSSASGNAGVIDVSTAGALSIVHGGEISSATSSSGRAGSVSVSAATVSVDGASSSIKASAASGSSGQTGNVAVAASRSITLSNGGSLSIRNDATVDDPAVLVPTTLSVTAADITLKDAQITAASSGNAAASDVQVSFSNRLYLDPSSITTSSNLGNGGAIAIQGGKLVVLENSQITTSVLGPSGNGGDISVTAEALVMNTGFVHANTAADNASGGLVNISAQTLVASGSLLFVGGDTPFAFQPGLFGFNVIQAAAPTGVSGTVQLTSPVLDISGSLRELNAQTIDPGALGRSLCQDTGGSSLAPAGRGGLPPSARSLLRSDAPPVLTFSGTVPPAADRVQRALAHAGCF